jgi:acyl-CoA reductase-like NAD-dependent aldehyde dehydrogenase
MRRFLGNEALRETNRCSADARHVLAARSQRRETRQAARTYITDAIGQGARVVAGGATIERPGYFYAPTILDHVDDQVAIVAEEQFGPVLPVLPFTDEADALARANNSAYGLTASVWSGDAERAARLAQDLDTGQVSINSHGAGVLPHLPFGGHKWSGIGVENGTWGLYGFTELQVVTGPPREQR